MQGITYSVMSASWDEDREGDLFGVDEFQKNIGNIKEGLGRSRENAILRDRMANIGNDEMNMALTDLERREKAAAAQKTKQTLESKLKDELE
jgi:Photosynthesis affected mutant 68